MEYVENDLRYVKLRLISEWKEYCFWYSNVFFFYYVFFLLIVDYFLDGCEEKFFGIEGEVRKWLFVFYGFVCKF